MIKEEDRGSEREGEEGLTQSKQFKRFLPVVELLGSRDVFVGRGETKGTFLELLKSRTGGTRKIELVQASATQDGGRRRKRTRHGVDG